MCLSTLILWAIATAGMTSIVVDSKLLETPRDAASKRWPNSIGYWMSCYQCAGFACGAVCGAAVLAEPSNCWPMVFASAAAGSAVAQVFAVGMNLLERPLSKGA